MDAEEGQVTPASQNSNSGEKGRETNGVQRDPDSGGSGEPRSGPRAHPIAVVEQRVSNLAQGALCLVLLTGPFLHVLNLIPRGMSSQCYSVCPRLNAV